MGNFTGKLDNNSRVSVIWELCSQLLNEHRYCFVNSSQAVMSICTKRFFFSFFFYLKIRVIVKFPNKQDNYSIGKRNLGTVFAAFNEYCHCFVNSSQAVMSICTKRFFFSFFFYLKIRVIVKFPNKQDNYSIGKRNLGTVFAAFNEYCHCFVNCSRAVMSFPFVSLKIRLMLAFPGNWNN